MIKRLLFALSVYFAMLYFFAFFIIVFYKQMNFTTRLLFGLIVVIVGNIVLWLPEILERIRKRGGSGNV